MELNWLWLPICLLFAMGALVLLNPHETLSGRCSVDIKWENYSCMVRGDEYISCPHPTHIDCEGKIPLSMIDKYTM
jgi:hypothetical protein